MFTHVLNTWILLTTHKLLQLFYLYFWYVLIFFPILNVKIFKIPVLIAKNSYTTTAFFKKIHNFTHAFIVKFVSMMTGLALFH